MRTATPIATSEIHEQVDKILGSQGLAGKSQLKKLLQMLVQNMDSQPALERENIIGEMWPGETKTKGPADVATEINRLRRTLEAYYEDEGKNDPILIYLPIRNKPGAAGEPERRWIAAAPRGIAGSIMPRRLVFSRKAAPAAVLIGIVVIVAYAYIALRTDRRPHSARLDETTLTILNVEGKELWHKTFPNGFWPGFKQFGPKVWIGSLDGGSHMSVLFPFHTAVEAESHSTTLICYSDRGVEQWRWTPGRELPELQGSPVGFTMLDLDVRRLTPNGPPRIVVSSRHSLYYPHQIAILDTTGKMVSEYWHSGHLDHMLLADLDGDGRQEIVASGISNGYRQATLVVLDPDRVAGASSEAARPEIQIHGMGAAQERIRLLFARSDLNRELFTYNRAESPSIENHRIHVAVQEGSGANCAIDYEFDTKFRLLGVEAYDDFVNAHKEFYSKGKNNHQFTAREETEFQKVRCLVGCESDFVPSAGARAP